MKDTVLPFANGVERLGHVSHDVEPVEDDLVIGGAEVWALRDSNPRPAACKAWVVVGSLRACYQVKCRFWPFWGHLRRYAR
jgi:hypothetical protein